MITQARQRSTEANSTLESSCSLVTLASGFSPFSSLVPGLSPTTSDLVFLAEGYGIGHRELVRTILNTSLARQGLIPVESPDA